MRGWRFSGAACSVFGCALFADDSAVQDAARRAKSFIEATAEIENEDLVSSNNGARDGVDKSLALLSKTGGDKRKGVVLGEGKDKVREIVI